MTEFERKHWPSQVPAAIRSWHRSGGAVHHFGPTCDGPNSSACCRAAVTNEAGEPLWASVRPSDFGLASLDLS